MVLKLHTVTKYVLQMCSVEPSVWSTKNCRKKGSELRRIRDILGYLYNTLSAALWYEVPVLGFWNFTHGKNIYADMQRRGFSLIDHKMLKLQGTEVRRIWVILGLLYSTARLRVCCDVVRTTLCGRICKGNGVKKTLWERRCEKGVVRKTLWERRCERDVVRKT